MLKVDVPWFVLGWGGVHNPSRLLLLSTLAFVERCAKRKLLLSKHA